MPQATSPQKPPGFLARHRRLRWCLIALLLCGGAGALYYLGLQIWASFEYRAATAAADRHDYKQASYHIVRYLRVRSWDWEGWILAARSARQANDFDQAARWLRQAEKNGAPPVVLGLESRLLIVQSGNHEEAERLLEYCLKNQARPETALMLQATAEGFLHNEDAAKTRMAADLWLRLRLTDADQAQGLIWLGEADKITNDVGPAIEHFQKAVDLAPEHPMARILLVAILVHDQPERARPHLELLKQKRPNDPEVLFQTARMHRYLGETEDAVRLLDQLIAGGTTSVPALLERAKVALDLTRPKEAEPYLQKALANEPFHRLANVAMADCLRQMNRPDEAKVFDERAREIEAKSKRAKAKDKS